MKKTTRKMTIRKKTVKKAAVKKAVVKKAAVKKAVVKKAAAKKAAVKKTKIFKAKFFSKKINVELNGDEMAAICNALSWVVQNPPKYPIGKISDYKKLRGQFVDNLQRFVD